MGHGSDHCIDHDTPMAYCHQCRDDEIARCDAEIARLMAQIDEDNRVILAVREHSRQLRAALAAHKRALAAGPAALREGAPSLWSGEAAAREVERAQADAMKEKP